MSLEFLSWEDVISKHQLNQKARCLLIAKRIRKAAALESSFLDKWAKLNCTTVQVRLVNASACKYWRTNTSAYNLLKLSEKSLKTGARRGNRKNQQSRSHVTARVSDSRNYKPSIAILSDRKNNILFHTRVPRVLSKSMHLDPPNRQWRKSIAIQNWSFFWEFFYYWGLTPEVAHDLKIETPLCVSEDVFCKMS